MLLGDGIVKIYKITDDSESGSMPSEKLTYFTEAFYGERTVGFSRQYSAKSVGDQVDMLIRIWQDRTIIPKTMCAIPEDGEQYRIDMVQQIVDDEDGLKYTDLTLSRLEKAYELNIEETED